MQGKFLAAMIVWCSEDSTVYLQRDGQQCHNEQVFVIVDEPIGVCIEVLHEEVALQRSEQQDITWVAHDAL